VSGERGSERKQEDGRGETHPDPPWREGERGKEKGKKRERKGKEKGKKRERKGKEKGYIRA
jgi:hypothetical protein